MSDLKPCQYPSDLPGQLRFWAKECDRTNHGCHVRALLAEAADELDRRTQPDQLPGPGKLMPDNAPLTMEELRGMDFKSDPIWDSCLNTWCVVRTGLSADGKAIYYFGGGNRPLEANRFYRRKPEPEGGEG